MNKGVTSRNSTTITRISNEPIEIPDSEPLLLDDEVQIINSQDKCVILDDDDSDVIIEEDPGIIDIDSDDLEIIENNNTPIVIEDEDRNCVINPLNYVKQKQDRLLDTVCQENSLLAQLIEDAINLDTSGAMKRIIQRMLIPLYLSCNIRYKESEAFKNTIKQTSILLEKSPHLKFSHIKSVCDKLKHVKINWPQVVRQRSASTPKKRKCILKNSRKHKKTREDPTNVDLTKENKKKDNIQSTTSKANKIDDICIELDTPITSISPSSNKENIVNENIQTTNEILDNNSNNTDSTDNNINNIDNNTEIDSNNLLRPHNAVTTQITLPEPQQQTVEILDNNSNNTDSTDNNINNIDNNTEIDSNNLLRPHYAVTTQITLPEPQQQTVETLEKEIAILKSKLERIEEQEVTDDSMTSPYLVAESLKSKIVKLYKQLCDLMGTESTKRHEVKLQVVNGHPPGPARCLEEYINANLDEHGNPPFPDIFEVVHCVKRAVEEDRLNTMVWNKKKIVAEAQVLLKHYGNAIQKRRKKREWRNIVSRCKEELVDPADLDPALEAKLLANSRIAKRNEDEIVNRYARLEKENSSNPAFRLSLEPTAEDSESDDEDIHSNTVGTNILEAPSHTMTDSTTNIENIQPSNNLSIINPESNVALNAINSRSILKNNQRGSLSIANSTNVMRNNVQNDSNVINTTNIVNCNLKNGSSLINQNFTANLQNCQILIVDPQNSSVGDLHGSICYINSTPVLLTRMEGGLSFNNSTNADGSLQNAANNFAGNLQNGPNFINNLSGNLQNGQSLTNSSNHLDDKPQSPLSNINTLNNLAGNLQNEPSFTNCSNNTAANLKNEPNFVNNTSCNLQNEPGCTNPSNNIANNLQTGNHFTNSNTLAGNQQTGNNFIIPPNNLQNRPNTETSNNLEGSLQNGPNNKESNIQSSPIVPKTEKQRTLTNVDNKEYNRTNMLDSTEMCPNTDTSNNLESNLQNGPNNKESNLESLVTKTEKQSTFTNIDNIEYNRTVMMDSNGSDTDTERKKHTDIVTYTNNVKERDKSEEDEIEYKIKVKQEEDDVIKLLSELGSDCVATVFDIEDPFLVIEISDSSDEEV